MFALVAERLKHSEAHRAASSHRRLVAIRADERDFAEVNVREQSSNLETRRMASLHSTPNSTLDNRVLLRLPRGRVLAANPGRVAVVYIVAADLPAVISTKAVWPPHSAHVGEKLLDVRGSLRLSPHTVWPHPPRSAVHEHDQIQRPAQGRFVRAGQIDMDDLHGPPCAQCRLPRCPRTYPLSPQAATTRMQHTRQGDPMLLSRLPRKAFVLVAGIDVKVMNIDHLLGLPYSEWALSRGENRCSGTYATSEKSMFINLFKGLRCRGVECGGGGNVCN